MALNVATAAIGFLLAASAVSMVTVGTISLVKTIKAEQEWKEINTKLTAVKNSNGMSSLADVIKENQEENKEHQKLANATITLIQEQADLKDQLKRNKEALDNANAQKTKLEKAVHTLVEMQNDFTNILANFNTNDNVQAAVDGGLWDPFINSADGRFRFNWGNAGEIDAHKDALIDALADVDGQRSGAQTGGAVVLDRMLRCLSDTDANDPAAGGAAARATLLQRRPAINTLDRTWQPMLAETVKDIKKLKAAVKKATADLKDKTAELEALQKKNK